MRFARFAAAVLCSALATATLAQDRPQAILVLDASGSMWGQIDGKAKITIAQEMVGELLGEIPADQDLGLTVYGHRRKGDCADIETLVQPGGDTREAIVSAVNGLSPKGKTPLSAAVIQAAEDLRYTEEKATVILVSDGIETCDFDPCEVGRELEKTGVDFTTHVIGFDVSEPEERAQLQCLADETGGVFKTASNALELGTAMLEIVDVAPEPEPEPTLITIKFQATDGEDGPVIGDTLVWTLFDGQTALVQNQLSPGFSRDLAFGEYRVEVLRPTDEAFAEVAFGVGEVPKTVTVPLPEFRPAATIEAADTAVAGVELPVRWTGPGAKTDYIAVGLPGEKANVHYTYTREGPLLDLTMPPTPGTYELRYFLADGRKVLATKTIEITPVTATLTAPDLLPAGGTVDVTWTGPDYELDYLAIAEPGDKGYKQYVYTRKGSPAPLQMPSTPGTYELRYVMHNKKTVLATQSVEVTAVTATVTPPAALPAGSKVPVDWTGPDDDLDYIAIFPRGEDRRYASYAYTRNGSPADLQLPSEPGDYDIAYVQDADKNRLVVVPVTITAVSATVTAPAELPAGSKVSVDWTGPDDQGDFLALFPRGETKRYVGYAYTRNGSPAEFQLPSEPGDYDLAYVQNAGKNLLVTTPVTVSAVSGSVTPPAELPAGATVPVEWTGPDDDRDFIAVFERGETRRYLKYAYTGKGSPVQLQLPTKPGDYDIAYVQSAGKNLLVVTPVTISAVTGTLSAPDTVQQGAVVPVEWTGPNDDRDFLAVFPRGEERRYINYAYTAKGSPAMLKMPAEPGEYDIAYVQSSDKTQLVKIPVTVGAASATLTLAGDTKVGGNLAVIWEGPDNPRDYIAITQRGEEKYTSFTYTSQGSPLIVKLPEAPGDYDVVYKLAEGNTTIARMPITVE